MWERTLQDLIRGLRANKNDESKFIAQAIAEIRQEIRSKDMELKAGAVLKLTYLDMLGYDMSWASFHVVEVMSSPRIHMKSVGYLAAAESFTPETDVLMLTTNQLKKDLSSKPEDVTVTLNGLSHIITPDLARDLAHDLIAMLNHSRAHIRKRAVIAVYKVFVNYPEIVPYGITRLRERLEDTDPGVVAATVNALCELVHRNPKDYLTMAPQLFHLMTTSSNNWMLIKIIKLFGALSPYEPRLVKKLQPPITDLISTTPAISLLYECVHTCITGGMLQGASGNALARTCVTKLAAFLQDPDQNLKYIALLAMTKIVPSHPELVAEYQDMIISSVDDPDISIRMRTLDLLTAMVSRTNLQTIVQQLLSHLVRPDTSASGLPSAAQSLSQYQYRTPLVSATPKSTNAPSQSPAYRLTLSQRILALGAQETYENVVDLEWYLSVLVDLAYVAGVNVGQQIRDQLVDIVGRVRAARRFAVQLMSFLANASEEGGCSEVLWAAAWICGEHCGELAEPQKLLPHLLQPGLVALDPEIVAVYLQAATKVFGYWAAEQANTFESEDLPKIRDAVDMTLERAGEFATSPDIEVQERAAEMVNLFTFVRADLSVYRPRTDVGMDMAVSMSASFGSGFGDTGFGDDSLEPGFPKSLYLIRPLFSAYELNAVAAEAQSLVDVPEDLNLDAWIVPPPREFTEPFEPDDTAEPKKKKKSKKGKEKELGTGKSKGKSRSQTQPESDDVAGPVVASRSTETAEERAERERRKAERRERLRDDPYYLIDDRPSRASVNDVDSIPVVRLDDLPPLSQGEPPPTEDARLPSLRNSSASSVLQTFVIDKTARCPRAACRGLRHGRCRDRK
ncbi:adaptin N terminal region-domain-containing protein [Fomitopsis serialis]|uniref:adaptin N terminal region-domain-containing protein n=1 Tax=Fomitopsis serialis TaxID=139415 RepID=UPI002007FB35|nr:adaptin N terminal region-domain-containing protein [Neoantrodia serialis]KAH9929816.1 adaptin N terminal region-domain-containing protein [Neoantrodia serialis]